MLNLGLPRTKTKQRSHVTLPACFGLWCPSREVHFLRPESAPVSVVTPGKHDLLDHLSGPAFRFLHLREIFWPSVLLGGKPYPSRQTAEPTTPAASISNFGRTARQNFSPRRQQSVRFGRPVVICRQLPRRPWSGFFFCFCKRSLSGFLARSGRAIFLAGLPLVVKIFDLAAFLPCPAAAQEIRLA